MSERLPSVSSSPTTKVYVDWGKLLQITLITVATVVLGLAGVISGDAVIGILAAGAGYIFGNGKSVREGLPTAPLIGRKLILDDDLEVPTTVVIDPDEV